jgi:hypothetical protein
MDIARRILREARYDTFGTKMLERMADVSFLFRASQDQEGYLEPLYTISTN